MIEPVPILISSRAKYQTYRVGTGQGRRYVFYDGEKEVDAYGMDYQQAKRNLQDEQKCDFSKFELIREYWGVKIPSERKAKRRPPAPRRCIICNDNFNYLKMVEGRCVSCHDKHLAVLREDARKLMELDLERYKDKMEECTTGVCDMLAVHHDRLKDDDQWLRTEFMIGQICGEEMRQKYLKKTMGGKI